MSNKNKQDQTTSTKTEIEVGTKTDTSETPLLATETTINKAPPNNEKKQKKKWLEIAKEGNQDEIQECLSDRIKTILSEHGLDDYLTLLLFDPFLSIADTDLNRLYQAASSNEGKNKSILLIVYSNGGSIEPAYLISKTLKALSGEKFVVAVPRMAKSAATLVCLGADEIHMGLTSQLGPIDPQINGLPALGLSNSLDTLANLASKFPAAGEMLSSYLKSQLDLRILGYFNRVTESAVQYAERLLAGKELGTGKTARDVADQLVNYYKDHGFVIDVDEAISLLGPTIVKTKTKEYNAANDIFSFLDLFLFVLNKEQKKRFYYTGGIMNGLSIIPSESRATTSS